MNAPLPPPAAAIDGDARKAKIAEAVAALNHAENAHWTQGGKPDLNALKENLGFQVSRAEVEAAAPDAKRQDATEPSPAPAAPAPAAPAADTLEQPAPAPAAPIAAEPVAPAPAAPAPAAPKAAKPTEGGAFTVKNTHNGTVNIRGVIVEKGKTRTLTAEELENDNVMARINHAISNGVLQKV